MTDHVLIHQDPAVLAGSDLARRPGKVRLRHILFMTIGAAIAYGVSIAAALAQPLPSWNDTAARQRILAFVEEVTDPGAVNYVAPEARIAVFDNDGTLWSEQPAYFQLAFAIDTLKAMAAEDPSILSSDALKAALSRLCIRNGRAASHSSPCSRVTQKP